MDESSFCRCHESGFDAIARPCPRCQLLIDAVDYDHEYPED